MTRSDDSRQLVTHLAERATTFVLQPPTGDDPVVDFATPDELLAVFESSVALAFADDEHAHSADALLAAADLVVRHSMHTSHPRFVNQNFAGPDPIAVVGDWLGAALNTTGATFEVAPVFTLMESAVLDKLARLAGYVGADDDRSRVPMLPNGMFCPGGSSATLFALQLARHRRQPDIAERGAGPERLVVFVSSSGHYAATKAAALLGIGTDQVVKVDTDHEGSMEPAALVAAVTRARSNGGAPLAVIGTAGTTVTSAFDELHAIADVCELHEMWFHVDGCYGGSALFAPEQAHRLDGVGRSDSFVWNLHKMMGMTQQCTALLVKRPEQLAACFAGRADYLFQPDKQFAEYDSGDRTFQCARRVDVLKLWLAWKFHGDSGFAARIDHAVAMADHTRRKIVDSQGVFVPVVSGSFTNVVFVWVPPKLRPLGDPVALDPSTRTTLHDLAPRIKARMQVEGTGMIGYQPVHNVNAFRMICMSPMLQASDIDTLLDLIDRYGRELA